jgi:uncharacterized membrane protein
MTKPVKYRSVLYHWVAWMITIEVVHVIASVHAAYEPGVAFRWQFEQFKIMYEIPWQNYIGIAIAAFVFANMTHYWYRTRRPRLDDSVCQHCGYQLEGLPSDARCPECGKEV